MFKYFLVMGLLSVSLMGCDSKRCLYENDCDYKVTIVELKEGTADNNWSEGVRDGDYSVVECLSITNSGNDGVYVHDSAKRRLGKRAYIEGHIGKVGETITVEGRRLR